MSRVETRVIKRTGLSAQIQMTGQLVSKLQNLVNTRLLNWACWALGFIQTCYLQYGLQGKQQGDRCSCSHSPAPALASLPNPVRALKATEGLGARGGSCLLPSPTPSCCTPLPTSFSLPLPSSRGIRRQRGRQFTSK